MIFRRAKHEAAQAVLDQAVAPVPSPAMPGKKLPDTAYAHASEHLWDELARADCLIRAQTLRWRQTLADNKPAELWGMIHVTDREVDQFLEAPFAPFGNHSPVHGAQRFVRQAKNLRQQIDQRLTKTEAEMPLSFLCRRLHLNEAARDALLVCLLAELDGRYRRLFAYLQDDASRVMPNVELVGQILTPVLPNPFTWRTLFSPGHALFQNRILVQDESAENADLGPLSTRPVRVDNRIASWLSGCDALDPRLQASASLGEPPPALEDLHLETDLTLRLQRLAEAWQERPEVPKVIFVHGPYGSGRLSAATALCGHWKKPLVVLDCTYAASRPEQWEDQVARACRESVLRRGALFCANAHILRPEERDSEAWLSLVQRVASHGDCTFIALETAWEPAAEFSSHLTLSLHFPVTSYEQRLAVWLHLLAQSQHLHVCDGEEREALVRSLANGFQLTRGQILDAYRGAVAKARARDARSAQITPADLFEGCRLQSGRRLLKFGRRVAPRAGLDFTTLVLPARNLRQLEELRKRIRHRGMVYGGIGLEQRLSLGKGLIVLFTGSSGTGKTMAAELLAQEQGVDLYRIDLSAVISKYIGETEKNLSKVFTEAEDANAIIFFDECDALFGKRAEVKEARDRWANIEINFLLQKIEEYAGVVILASNLRQNIDEAFVRRLHAVVEFPYPDAEARFRIWCGMFPSGIERPADEAIRDLAHRFRLSGGNIKNILIDAAARAIDDRGEGEKPALQLHHLVLATAREYQKLGRPITQKEFGNHYFLVCRNILLSNPDAGQEEHAPLTRR